MSTLTLDELAAEIAGLPDRPPVERARAAAALIEAAKTTLARVRREAIWEATREQSYAAVARQLGVTEATINKAITDGRSGAARVRRAQKRRHDREREPEFARAAITAELLSYTSERLDLVDAVTEAWLERAAQGGYPHGLRGFVADWLRREAA